MSNHNPSARVQVRERSQLVHPGTCAVCGTSGFDRVYVDPDVNFEYEGAVYFCNLCAGEIAAALDCLSAEESGFLTNQNKELAEENASLKEQLDNVSTELCMYRSVIRESIGHSGADALMGATEEPQSESDSNDEPVTDGAGTEPESPEPVKVGGPNDSSRPTSRDRKPEREFFL